MPYWEHEIYGRHIACKNIEKYNRSATRQGANYDGDTLFQFDNYIQ